MSGRSEVLSLVALVVSMYVFYFVTTSLFGLFEYRGPEGDFVGSSLAEMDRIDGGGSSNGNGLVEVEAVDPPTAKRPWMTEETAPPILFVKIPKTGSTTLVDIILAIASAFSMKIGNANHLWDSIETCSKNNQSNLDAWMHFMEENEGKIDVLASHACFQPFMMRNEFWGRGGKPFVITVIRDPWERFISHYRYIRDCCVNYSPRQSWCSGPAVCTWDTFEVFSQNCREGCDTLRDYFGSLDNLKYFDLIITTERFNEGLVLLHLIYNFPWDLLLYSVKNTNNIIPVPKYTEELKEETLKLGLEFGVEVYKRVNEDLDKKIASLPNRKEFDRLVALMKEQTKG